MSHVAARQKFQYEMEPCPPVELRAPNFSGRRPSGLSNPWVVIFTEKKSACGKLASSNRAYQSPDHGCMKDFDNHKVTFRTNHTPLHRIAVQFLCAEPFGELQKNRKSRFSGPARVHSGLESGLAESSPASRRGQTGQVLSLIHI